MATPADQLALKVRWSLERLNDVNDETKAQNAQFLADIRSTQSNAAALRELDVVVQALGALGVHAWQPGSGMPCHLARALNNIFKQDEAACGQARSADGAAILARCLSEAAAEAAAEESLWDGGQVEETALQLLEALTTLVEVHTESQVAACREGAVHAGVQLLQSPAAVRRKAAELLRELLAGVAAAPDTSVYDAFAKELPGIFVQLHALLAQHSRVFGRVLPREEALLCDVLSEVVAHPACDAAKLQELQPQVMALVGIFVHCRSKKFTPEIEQALANALLAIVAEEKLAAGLREDQPAFELLRGFQAALTSPLAAAAVKQILAQLQSFVAELPDRAVTAEMAAA